MKSYLEDPRITAYALGELEGSELEEVKRLVEQNEEIRNYVAQIQSTAKDLSAIYKKEELVPLKKELREKMGKITSPWKIFGRSWILAGSGFAVASLALVLSTNILKDEELTPAIEPDAIVAQVVFDKPKEKEVVPDAPSKSKENPKKFAVNKDKSSDKVGLLAAFGGGGLRKNLDKAYSGTGDIAGGSLKATGAGDDIGSKFKDTGAGGKDTVSQNIAGVGTKGRGVGYGSGSDDSNSFSIELGGDEEDYLGTIDREAVRRVMRAGTRDLRACYELELPKIKSGQIPKAKVIFEWTIDDKGKALNTKVKSSTLGNQSIVTCMKERLSTWQFPKPPAGLVAEIIFPVSIFSNK